MSNGFGNFGGGGKGDNASSPSVGSPPNVGQFPGGSFGSGFGTPSQPAAAAGGFGTVGTPPPLPSGPRRGVVSVGRHLASTIQSDSRRVVSTDGRVVRLQAAGQSAETLLNSGQCSVDGVCVFDPKFGSNAAAHVIVWRSNGAGTVSVEGAPALREVPPTVKPDGEIEILTDAGTYVAIPGSIGRVIDIEELFSPKGLVLYGDNAKFGAVCADYPMSAEWVPLVDGIPEQTFQNGVLEYRIKLKGLAGELVLRYTPADLEFAGEPPDVQHPDRHLRLMVWPAKPTPNWKLFVVEVGAYANTMAWFGKYHWSLYFHPQGARGNREDDLRVEPCKSIKDQLTPLVRKYEGTFDREMPLRVATADRPHYIEIGSRELPSACGTLRLVPRVTATELNGMDGRPEQWGVDIGTSNSCVTRLGTHPTDPMQQVAEVINFNQIDSSAPNGSLVLCRIGDEKRPRSDLHWMPGIEGAGYREVDDPKPIEQIPSRLVLLADRLPNDLTSAEIRDMIPMCEAVVPPLQGRTTFAIEKVDDRTIDNLKWVDKNEDRRLARLEQYITCVLLMAAARVRPTAAVEVMFSQPLSFSEAQREALQEAVNRATERVSKLIGVDVKAPKLFSDESHCILEQFTKEAAPQAGAPVWVLCDIGGGSIDLAVAMGAPSLGYAFLAADSIKFGANLVFKNLLEVAGQQLANTSHVPTQRQVVREMIARSGFGAVVSRCPPNTRKRVLGIIQCYYYLVAEYVARTVAGTVRNPKRFKQVAQLPTSQGGFGFPASLPANAFQLELHLLVTGNGFKTFEAIQDDISTERKMEDFKDTVRRRVHDLLKEPVDLPDWPADDNAWFGQVPAPRGKGYLGLTAGPDKRYLKEALAFSIIMSGAAGGSARKGLDTRDFLAAPNGLTEFSKGIPIMGIAGSNRPWFAFVGGDRIKASRPDAQTIELDKVEPWFVASAEVVRDDHYFRPQMPDQIARLAQDLSWNLDVAQVYQAHAAEIARQIKNSRGERQWSLLKLIYEIGYTRLFSANDFLA